MNAASATIMPRQRNSAEGRAQRRERAGRGLRRDAGGNRAGSRFAAPSPNFKAVEHRLEYVATVRGVEYYNDSKATNVDATIKALESFPGRIHLILGGKDKGSDYSVLNASAERAREARVHHRRSRGQDRIAGARSGDRQRRHAGSGRAARQRSRNAGRHRAAGSGLRQLRSVRQLRASRPRLQRSGPATGGERPEREPAAAASPEAANNGQARQRRQVAVHGHAVAGLHRAGDGLQRLGGDGEGALRFALRIPGAADGVGRGRTARHGRHHERGLQASSAGRRWCSRFSASRRCC